MARTRRDLLLSHLHETCRWYPRRAVTVRRDFPANCENEGEGRRSELANNPGTSVTNAIEQIAAEVMDALTPMSVPVCIEHYPSEATGGSEEGFDLVVFAHDEIRYVMRFGIGRKELGAPTWKPLDRRAVEVLVACPA